MEFEISGMLCLKVKKRGYCEKIIGYRGMELEILVAGTGTESRLE